MKDYSFLGSDEDMVGEYTLSCSTCMSLLKYGFDITNKRLIVNEPRKLWIIPVGTSNEAYSLNNISRVSYKKNMNLKRLVIGLALLWMSLSEFRTLFFLAFAGLVFIYASLEEAIIIQNNSGRIAEYSISMLERSKAKELVSKLNKAIAKQL